MDEFEANKFSHLIFVGYTIDNPLGRYRYGVEIGRLHLARVEAKNGYDIARRGGVAQAVQDDIKVYFTLYLIFFLWWLNLSRLSSHSLKPLRGI